LAPAGEAWHGEEPLLVAGLESVGRWPGFAADVCAASGIDPWLAHDGTLLVGATADDAVEVERVAALLAAHDIATEPVTRSVLRDAEPALSTRVRRVVAVPGDLSVHNRRLLDALLAAVDAAKVPLLREAADPVVDDGRIVGVRGRESNQVRPTDVVVVAAGSRLAEIGSLPPGIRTACRPVKGQILRLHGPEGLLHKTLRAYVDGVPVYVVPRRDGEIVVGATSEELAHDSTVTAEAVHDLLRTGLALVPGLRECEFVESIARHRPGTPDNLPLVGPTGVDGLLVAAGHFRGGVLLAPLTADAIAAYLDRVPIPEAAAAMRPQRLEPAR
ncbi:MAG: FAD-dependent oxidoreductase, partial [Actinomycetia bacterium]|nr:FAD-dependent oxidoreductase [Actinomycetes bacterium]